MIEIQFLKKNAERAFSQYQAFMTALNKEYPAGENFRWEMDELEGKVRRVKLPEMEWDDFDDAN